MIPAFASSVSLSLSLNLHESLSSPFFHLSAKLLRLGDEIVTVGHAGLHLAKQRVNLSALYFDISLQNVLLWLFTAFWINWLH